MYELFDHTADLGLRVTAVTLDELFADAARGLFAMIVERPDAIEPRVDVKFDIPGEDKAFLLFDWLRALLTTSEIDGVVFGEAGKTTASFSPRVCEMTPARDLVLLFFPARNRTCSASKVTLVLGL